MSLRSTRDQIAYEEDVFARTWPEQNARDRRSRALIDRVIEDHDYSTGPLTFQLMRIRLEELMLADKVEREIAKGSRYRK